MNFKTSFIFFLLCFLSHGCGVKGPPLKHQETVIDSYTLEYTGTSPSPEEIERAKKSKPTPSIKP